MLVSFNDVKYNFVNIYAPNNPAHHKSFFETLHEIFFPADFSIIGGDFNCYEYDSDKFAAHFPLGKKYSINKRPIFFPLLVLLTSGYPVAH